MGNAIQAAVAAKIQQSLDAQLSKIPVEIKVNGWVLSQMVETYMEAVSRLGVLPDTEANRKKAAKAGVKWESFRFSGRKAFAKAHTKEVTVKGAITWVYNPAGAAEAITEFENASKVLAALEGLQKSVIDRLK
jgi:hypothetical protein